MKEAIMYRRRFIKAGIISGLALSPLMISCGAAAPALSPVIIPPIASVAGKTVAEYLIEFVTGVAINIVSSSVSDWMTSLTGSQKDNVNRAEQDMRNMGFSIYATNVYNFANSVVFFGMSQPNGPDTCVTFMGKHAISLVEGPALMGIALSGKYWDVPNIEAPSALLPIKAHQAEVSDFNTNSSQPFRYDTPSGNMNIAYQANPSTQEGKVRVQSIVNNQLIHDKTFGISWS
jgi:hypothetical protein